MAGSDPTGAFVADEFRDNIRRVNMLGQPEDRMLRPIFLFPRVTVFPAVGSDDADLPLDWTTAPTSDDNPPGDDERRVYTGLGDDEVACAWQAAGGRGGTQSNETTFGDFDVQRLVISMLDVDRPKVVGFDRVKIAGAMYWYQFEEAATGLYEVTEFSIVVAAKDLGRPAVAS